MDIFIDRKFWNKVIKKLPANYAAWLKNNLKESHFEIKPEYVQRKDRKSPYGYRMDKKYKNKNMGWKLKRDFVLRLSSKQIKEGFLYKKCFAFPPKKRENNIPIEKIMIEILIQDYSLNEKVIYMGEPVIELEKDNLENKANRGFVYLIRNDDIYKIGITDNLLRRFNQLKPDEVLNVVRCSNFESLEKELHKKFKEYRIPQTEYFRLSKNQIENVNIEMTKGANF